MGGLFFSYIKSKGSTSDFAWKESDSLEMRGRNSASLLYGNEFTNLYLYKSNSSINNLFKLLPSDARIVAGYSGLNVNSEEEIAPLVSKKFILYQDGLILERKTLKEKFSVTTSSNTDLLMERIDEAIESGKDLYNTIKCILSQVKGTVNSILMVPEQGRLYIFSNHGSLYALDDERKTLVASEKHWLQQYANDAVQVNGILEIDLNISIEKFHINQKTLFNSSPSIIPLSGNFNVLKYKLHDLKRCSRCILPETMPYIRFDEQGVCNYCHNYKIRNQPKNKEELFNIIDRYRRSRGNDCIVPFSGGRDSSYSLHVIVNELKLNPIAYTYDWGMVTDIGRRNVSLMCSILKIENIVVADDIEKKRKNISMNFSAWLKNPHLGMLNILTAGDKHFFKYINKVKENTGVKLNLWGINPLEVTHFKTGFLGIKPDFERQRVYASGMLGQIRYQAKRLLQMAKSPGYFNSSLWDTWTGEYYRSSAKKTDFFHIFDYWQWSEHEVNDLLACYGWELASDTSTTWRIGDGTAGIYNYIYYTLAGFTEHDAFRSNQVREGELTREQALKFIEEENAPCPDNIRWYLQSIGFDFSATIHRINSIPRLHEKLY